MVDDLEARLRLILGLNRYEAKVYMTLLGRGPLKALEIAGISGVPRGRVYDVLRSLEAKGLVNRRDHEYGAVHPRRALSRAGQRILLDAFDTIRRLEELAEALEDKYHETGVDEEIKLIHGLKESLATALASVANCKNIIYFTAFKSAEKSSELWELLSPLVRRLSPNVRIMIPPMIDPPSQIIDALRERGVEVRKHPSVMIDSMVACDTVIIGLPSGTYDVISVYVRHSEFAEGLWRRLDEFWEESREL